MYKVYYLNREDKLVSTTFLDDDTAKIFIDRMEEENCSFIKKVKVHPDLELLVLEESSNEFESFYP